MVKWFIFYIKNIFKIYILTLSYISSLLGPRQFYKVVYTISSYCETITTLKIENWKSLTKFILQNYEWVLYDSLPFKLP